MSWIDVAIVSLVVISALHGWSQGMLRQVGAFLGRIAGFVGGSYLALAISPHITEVAWRPLDVVLIIATCVVAGGLIVRFFGGVFSRRIHEGRLGLVDSVLGASVGIVGTLVTVWLIAAILAVVPWGSVGQSINDSVILKTVQHALPTPPSMESRLQGVLDQVHVPSLFANVVGPTVPGVSHSLLTTKNFVTTPNGVVAVEASGACNLVNQGTGFLVAPNVVVTVAHLLAGEKIIAVDGHVGHVILFDPRSDLAAISVSGLSSSPLTLGVNTSRGTIARVVGYSSALDRVSSGAISLGTVVAPGRDIYSGPLFRRSMDVVISTVNTMELGAPVIVNNAVVGVVAQRASTSASLAYAIPVAQVRIELSRVSSQGVSTQRCIN